MHGVPNPCVALPALVQPVGAAPLVVLPYAFQSRDETMPSHHVSVVALHTTARPEQEQPQLVVAVSLPEIASRFVPLPSNCTTLTLG